jgi:thiol-disulfide isomerase/thioredoxin
MITRHNRRANPTHMKTNCNPSAFLRYLPALCVSLFLLPGSGIAFAAAPLMLDVTRFHAKQLITAEGTNKAFVGFTGVQQVDGLPFNLLGHGVLYGRKEANWRQKSEEDYPDFTGVKVGRRFAELHLLHAANWMDVNGEAIARVRLNYTDGTAFELPIGYGVQVRDWQRLRSEEKETLVDADSKIIWRGGGLTSYKSKTRVFKSRLLNPLPDKEVVTIDFVSTKRLACYDLFAATVADRDPSRIVTPPVPADEPERNFEGNCRVLVVDADSGKPLAGVLVDPGMTVDETGVIAAPLRTDAEGIAIIRYPTGGRVTQHYVRTELAGYANQGFSDSGEFPEQTTLRMAARDESAVRVVPARRASEVKNIPTARPELLPIGSLAPDVEFIRADNEQKGKLSDLRGKAVVLEFWATWCGPCQEPMAKLQDYRKQHPHWGDQVEIVTMSIDDGLAKVRGHLTSRGWTNTFNVWAGAEAWQAEAPKAYRVSGIPTCYLIDAQGKIAKVGHPASLKIGELVDQLLAPAKASKPGN